MAIIYTQPAFVNFTSIAKDRNSIRLCLELALILLGNK